MCFNVFMWYKVGSGYYESDISDTSIEMGQILHCGDKPSKTDILKALIREAKCEHCNGVGYIDGQNCYPCDLTGWNCHNETYELLCKLGVI